MIMRINVSRHQAVDRPREAGIQTVREDGLDHGAFKEPVFLSFGLRTVIASFARLFDGGIVYIWRNWRRRAGGCRRLYGRWRDTPAVRQGNVGSKEALVLALLALPVHPVFRRAL